MPHFISIVLVIPQFPWQEAFVTRGLCNKCFQQNVKKDYEELRILIPIPVSLLSFILSAFAFCDYNVFMCGNLELISESRNIWYESCASVFIRTYRTYKHQMKAAVYFIVFNGKNTGCFFFYMQHLPVMDYHNSASFQVSAKLYCTFFCSDWTNLNLRWSLEFVEFSIGVYFMTLNCLWLDHATWFWVSMYGLEYLDFTIWQHMKSIPFKDIIHISPAFSRVTGGGVHPWIWF